MGGEVGLDSGDVGFCGRVRQARAVDTETALGVNSTLDGFSRGSVNLHVDALGS